MSNNNLNVQELVHPTDEVTPKCYAYTTPGVTYNEGWTKIGYTKRDVDVRIKEQTQTAHIIPHKEWAEEACFDADSNGDVVSFTDKQFHAYLEKRGIDRMDPESDDEGCPEWFKISGSESHDLFWQFKADRGILQKLGVVPYRLRSEQKKAVKDAEDYFHAHEGENPEYLWNAKPRFGKTLSAYDLCRALDAHTVLIVTNRPVIANSWYADYEKFFGPESGYWFVSNHKDLINKRGVLTREVYLDRLSKEPEKYEKFINFVSLQDMKGSLFLCDTGTKEKLEYIKLVNWDILIIDEAHEGVDTSRTETVFDQIRRKYTLHLSGTPFKALANDKFGKAVTHWTYADEQRSKDAWDPTSEYENPYQDLPRLNMFTYRMSDIVLEKVKAGADFRGNGDTEAYAFDLNEFFKTKKNGEFEHDDAVNKFLDALTTNEKFPFSTEKLRGELRHTVWVMQYVRDAKSLALKLAKHPLFKDYTIVLAVGDGRIKDNGEFEGSAEEDRLRNFNEGTKSAYEKVTHAIAEAEMHDGCTITITVGQLTTGVTIPEWSAVLMLSNMSSPEKYIQTAFRVQNPCMYNRHGVYLQKENAYVFDFDPARTLDIVEKFATGLSGRNRVNNDDERREDVRELLNFFPIYGEDPDGMMISLDPNAVLSIPHEIHAKEVVRCGFMSNFLFQNISRVIAQPQVVTRVLRKLSVCKENNMSLPNVNADDWDVDDEGHVDVPPEKVSGIEDAIFGDKIYGDTAGRLNDAVTDLIKKSKSTGAYDNKDLERYKKVYTDTVVAPVLDKVIEKYGSNVPSAVQTKLKNELGNLYTDEIVRRRRQFVIDSNSLDAEKNKEIEKAKAEGREDDIEVIHAMYDEEKERISNEFKASVLSVSEDVVKSTGETIVRTCEERRQVVETSKVEDDVRAHLRGFSRSIPAFLMAYGYKGLTLDNFDKCVPGDVFEKITGITLDEFRLLRDGGEQLNEETGEYESFAGHLFNPTVFNDSVNLFMEKREELMNYFLPGEREDIFDYIPTQRKDRVFTPKSVVKKMVDMLEQENPGCFDDDKVTFLDPYMKSGMFIAEIVKRLFMSKVMEKKYPDTLGRLYHILEHQVYGLAPDQIYYDMSVNFILGFGGIEYVSHLANTIKHNFRVFDGTESAKNGTFAEEVGKLFE